LSGALRNCHLFEGVSPSLTILVLLNGNAKMANQKRKKFFEMISSYLNRSCSKIDGIHFTSSAAGGLVLIAFFRKAMSGKINP
jgi:hypothetical protein